MSDARDEFTGDDVIEADLEAKQTVTNDAVAGETVLPGPGDGNDGPTGGMPREQEPVYAENDLADEEVDLDDEPDGDG